jgi:hypothetical protein
VGKAQIIRSVNRDLLVFPRQIFWFGLIIELVFTMLLATLLLQGGESCKAASLRLGWDKRQ